MKATHAKTLFSFGFLGFINHLPAKAGMVVFFWIIDLRKVKFLRPLIRKFLFSFFNQNFPPMGSNTTFQDTIDLVFGELDLQNDTLEGLLKSAYSAGANAALSSTVIDQTKGDVDVSPFIRGFKNLAQMVGKVNQSLSPDQAQAVKDAVNDLLDISGQPLLTGALEQQFSNYLDIVVNAKSLKGYADTLVDPNAQ